MERLQPQIPQEQLLSTTQLNYKTAQSYYEQRRNAFKTFLRQNQSQAENIEEIITKRITDIWNKEIFDKMSQIYWQGKEKNLTIADLEKEVSSKFNINKDIKDKLLFAIRQGNPQTFYSGLGQAFEIWLQDYGIGPVIDRGIDFAELHGTNLINTFVSGAMTSLSSIVSGQKNIRPDLIMSTRVQSDFIKQDGVLTAPSGLALELQLNWENLIPSAEEMSSTNEILQEFLDPKKGNFYGLSAKSWSNSNGKSFMQSSVLQKALNATFNSLDNEGKRHSWEPDYTIDYVTYVLSHHIFEIIGPTNVGLVTRTGFMWMDQFLESHIFFMKVQLEKYWKRKNGGLGRLYPQITDSNVYVRNYNIATAKSIKARKQKNKLGEYITLKIV